MRLPGAEKVSEALVPSFVPPENSEGSYGGRSTYDIHSAYVRTTDTLLHPAIPHAPFAASRVPRTG